MDTKNELSLDEGLKLLQKDFAYVSFTFSDGSVQVILTTLSTELYNEEGVIMREDMFYDFWKERYVAPPADATLTITREKPELDEVNRFGMYFT